MGRSIFDPDLLSRLIRTKKRQLGEIEQDLENLPLDHPGRLRLFERRLVLEKGIPELEAEYQKGSSERRMASGDPLSEGTPVQSKLAKETPKLVFTRRNGKSLIKGKVTKVALWNTLETFTGTLAQIRILVINSKGRVSIGDVKKTFGRDELSNAADDADWGDWIEIFGSEPTATAKGAALVFLEKKTRLNRSTIEKYCSMARKEPKVTPVQKR